MKINIKNALYEKQEIMAVLLILIWFYKRFSVTVSNENKL